MVILDLNAQTILDEYVDKYVDYRKKDEYGTSAFWYWFYQVKNYVLILDQYSTPIGDGLVYRMPYLGNIIFSREIINGEIFVVVTDFDFNHRNFLRKINHQPLRGMYLSSPSIGHTSAPLTAKHQSFVLPEKMKVLKGTYYNGLTIGYYNRKYIILKSDRQPLVEKWFDKRPKIFKKPFGKYNIIAHVSYYNSLFAVGIDGQMYDMHRIWNDAYLQECLRIIHKDLIAESIKPYSQKMLFESESQAIRLNEGQLRGIIRSVISRLVA